MPLQSTLQHIYATNLDQQRGYPLRNPQLRIPDPGKELEEPYKSNGLQIGDIGYVDEYGTFNLLFNVKFPPSNDLGNASELNLPLHFDEPVAGDKISPGEVFKTGVTQIVNDARADDVLQFYKFVADAKKGAILILPHGATLFELDSKCMPDVRNHVKKYALAWCKHAQKDTLYLVTAVYRAKSWTLGSFKNGTRDKEIYIRVRANEQSGAPEYRWEHAFNVDNKQVSPGNTDLNQAVFIKGFKMTAGNIEQLMSGGWFDRLLATLQSAAKKWQPGPKIKYFPATKFSEPSHPLDVVNGILLDKNPGTVAITHDDDWIEMRKNKFPFEKLMEKCHVRHFMEANYSCDLDTKNNTVGLVRQNSEGKTKYEIVVHGGHTETIDVDYKPKLNEPLVDTPASTEEPANQSRLVITHMRLESFDVGNVDAGVCVLVQFGATTRRTDNKPHANIIEWDSEITLPSDEPADITVCGTFQLGSTLGTREISGKMTIDTGDMPGSAYSEYRQPRRFVAEAVEALKFSVGNAESRSSLLVTLERHFSYCETYFNYEESSDFVQETTEGFKAFYSYHVELKGEHLVCALDCFRSALEQCGSNPECRATAWFNLATSEFVQCQANGTYSKFNTSIDLYRKALQSRGDNHQDRPATLLLLAQVLLSHHGQEYDEFVVEEIEQLLAELPPDESRDRRTADAILATIRFYHAINGEHSADIDGLLANFQRGTYTPLYGYFDKPHLLHKLGFAFWRRFRLLKNFEDLDKSIALNAEALQVPDGHDDKMNIAACLGNSLLCALEARGELSDVDTSIGLVELGKRVIVMLDTVSESYAEGASAPSEDLQEQIDLRFAVAQIREQIKLMSSVERVWQHGAVATGDTTKDAGQGPSTKVENPLDDWNRDEETETECKRQLAVLVSFLGGEGDRKMREALERVNPEWPHKDHKIVATMQALEEHMPYYYTVLARRLRFVVEGWC